MKVFIDEIPEEKTFDDYSPDTEFVHREMFTRYDREALKRNELVCVFYDDLNYENSLTREELNTLLN